MNEMNSKLLSLFLICCLVLGQAAPLLAGPQDGKVIAGSATIRQESPTKVGITQTSDRVAINWQSFNIGANEQVQFYQPSSSSVALNRVVGPDASSIMGRLTANGQVFLVNPNGIIFGKGSQVDASGLMASTHNIRNEDFMAGRYLFNIPGKPGASVINEGIIRIADTGVAAFVAPAVANRGIIAAKLGKIALASANGFTLDFFGDQLLTFMVNDEVAKMAYDVQGNQLTSFVENSGRIEAQGGYVLLSAKAAEGVVHNVINQSGVIEATSVGQQNGEIILSGGPRGVVSNTGTLDASGKNEGETGGKVLVTGEKLGLFSGTAIDVSGYAGGGKALIGGDYLGGRADDATMRQLGISREPYAIQTATYTNMAQNAYINADALRYGKGGKVVLWSDDSTRAYGRITANGGSVQGDGGFVEISGKIYLDIFGIDVRASAPAGRSGTVLFDPKSVEIVTDALGTVYDVTSFPAPPGAGISKIAVSSVVNTLNSGTNVNIQSDDYLYIATDIRKTSGGDANLSFSAGTGNQLSSIGNIISTAGKLNTYFGASSSYVDLWGGNINTNGGILSFAGQARTFLSNQELSTNGGAIVFWKAVNFGDNVRVNTNGGNVVYYGDMNVGVGGIIRTNGGKVHNFGLGTLSNHGTIDTERTTQTEAEKELADKATREKVEQEKKTNEEEENKKKEDQGKKTNDAIVELEAAGVGQAAATEFIAWSATLPAGLKDYFIDKGIGIAAVETVSWAVSHLPRETLLALFGQQILAEHGMYTKTIQRLVSDTLKDQNFLRDISGKNIATTAGMDILKLIINKGIELKYGVDTPTTVWTSLAVDHVFAGISVAKASAGGPQAAMWAAVCEESTIAIAQTYKATDAYFKLVKTDNELLGSIAGGLALDASLLLRSQAYSKVDTTKSTHLSEVVASGKATTASLVQSGLDLPGITPINDMITEAIKAKMTGDTVRQKYYLGQAKSLASELQSHKWDPNVINYNNYVIKIADGLSLG